MRIKAWKIHIFQAFFYNKEKEAAQEAKVGPLFYQMRGANPFRDSLNTSLIVN